MAMPGSARCSCGRCTFILKDYHSPPGPRARKHRGKAGALIKDVSERQVLLVQSRGRLWGCPKGSREEGETYAEAAVREVREETGIVLRERQLGRRIAIHPDAVYYVLEVRRDEIELGLEDEFDVTGIGWFGIQCLRQLDVYGGGLTSQTRRVVAREFGLGVRRLLPRPEPSKAGTERASSPIPAGTSSGIRADT